MANTGQDILDRENLPKNIERLAAQKEMYFQAKRLFALQFLLTVVGTVVLAVGGIVIAMFDATFDLNWVRAIYGLLVAGADLFLLSPLIDLLRQRAATVQELFDCDVLGLQWNQVCCGDKPKPEDVKKYADKHLNRVKTYEKLKTWYAETIKEVDGPAAKAICQRSNFAYDDSIRKSFRSWILGITLATLTLLIVVAVAINASGRVIAAMSLFPMLPLFVFVGKLLKEHNTSIKNLNSLNSNVMTLWSDLLNKKEVDFEYTIRQIQDRIYQNRKTSPLIPEWFYDWQRNRLETQMYYGVEELVQQYQSTHQNLGSDANN